MVKAIDARQETADQVVVLHNLDWEIYEKIMEAHRDRSVPRFTYDQGELQIVSPSPEHEQSKEAVGTLVRIWAEEVGINILAWGSTTFKREDLQRGFEPDACFYIQHAARMMAKPEIDLSRDPPPELVIEIDVWSSSLDKLSIFAEVGVAEVWRYDRGRLTILRLSGGSYLEQEKSGCLPGLTPAIVEEFIENKRGLLYLDWVKLLRERARSS